MAGSNRLTGGQLIVRTLKAHGVRTAFALAGTAHTHVLFAMEDAAFRIVSGRHETATVCAADGYARVSGKLGVALIKGDQGLPNAVTGIMTAQLACSPVLVLVSLTPANTLEAQGEDDNDILDLVKGHCKWARTVPDAERLAEYVAAGARQALSGRPGVAVLGIPQHFEAAAVDAADRASAEPLPAPPAPDPDAVAAAARVIAAAKRPLIVAGSGAALADAGPPLRAIAETYRIPVFGHVLGRGLVPEDDRLGFSWPLAQVAAKEADAVLVVGARLGQRFGYGLAPRFSATARFVQIDIAPEEMGRNRPVDVAIAADARAALVALRGALTAAGTRAGDTGWVDAALAPRRARIDALGRDETPPIHPYRIGRELMKLMPEDAIYVGDGADIQNWMHGVLRIRRGRSYMDHYPLGSMGVGTPLAVGAAAAARDLAAPGAAPRPVVLVTGDGSFGFYCAELNGAALAGLKIVCVISNDGAWGTEKHGQVNALGRTVNCVLGQADYHLIAQAFGCAGLRIDKAADLAPALARAFAADGTTVLNVITDPDAGLVRKQDPRVQTVAFDDLVTNLRTHATPSVA